MLVDVRIFPQAKTVADYSGKEDGTFLPLVVEGQDYGLEPCLNTIQKCRSVAIGCVSTIFSVSTIFIHKRLIDQSGNIDCSTGAMGMAGDGRQARRRTAGRKARPHGATLCLHMIAPRIESKGAGQWRLCDHRYRPLPAERGPIGDVFAQALFGRLQAG